MGQSEEASENTNFAWKDYKERLKTQKMSNIPPYRTFELHSLRRLFESLQEEDKKLQLTALGEVEWFSDHPFFERIIQLFKDQMVKLNTQKMDFELFAVLLSGFHSETEMEVKLSFLFSILDVDRDGKVGVKDLAHINRLIHAHWHPMTNEESIRMATETLSRLHKNFLKKQDLSLLVSQDEIYEVMTAIFDQHFV